MIGAWMDNIAEDDAYALVDADIDALMRAAAARRDNEAPACPPT